MKIFFSILIFIIITFNIYPEKWVGQVATYNLIEGSKTADGQVFNPDNMTAACNGFRLGALVKVINVRTGKQIEVLITDRIKNDSNYFMLLSPKAANELGLPWETSLVVIDAKFSDVNSTEILPISGLIAEGTIDKENLKKFPDINWPDGDKTITKMTEEKNPAYDKTKKPDQQNKIKIDSDISDKEQIPNTDKGKNPNKIMQNYMLDEDSEANLKPKNEFNKTPNTKEKNIDEDKDEKLIPETDIIKKPENKKNLIDMEEEFPKKSVTQKPDKEKNQIDKDAESEKTLPIEEIKKIPLTKENRLDLDKDNEINPNKELTKLPEKEKIKIDEDKQTTNIVKTKITETENEKIEWVTSLQKGLIYIRFSTTFEKLEGERRLLLFKKVFKNVVGLKENNKYILLIGPVAKNDIDKVLKGLRDFGYKDSLIIQK